MIGDAMRVLLDAYTADMRETNPLFTAAIHGRFNHEMLAFYLENIRHLVSHTPLHLGRAEANANRLDRPHLESFYRSKAREEVGHDQWAVNDRRRAKRALGRPVTTRRSSEIESLLGFIEQLIDTDPDLYLAYILFTEYVVASMGAEWIEVLHERCGIDPAMMTIIGNHAELDVHHYEEGIEVIDELVTDPTKLPAMRNALAETIRRFEAFGAEVTQYAGEAAAVA